MGKREEWEGNLSYRWNFRELRISINKSISGGNSGAATELRVGRN
jgi:hypothetical protein